MTEFEYNEYKVVGYVDFFAGNPNAKIEVVGYTDWRNNFTPLKESESLKLFPPYGKVFAHNFAERYYETKGTTKKLAKGIMPISGTNLEAFMNSVPE